MHVMLTSIAEVETCRLYRTEENGECKKSLFSGKSRGERLGCPFTDTLLYDEDDHDHARDGTIRNIFDEHFAIQSQLTYCKMCAKRVKNIQRPREFSGPKNRSLRPRGLASLDATTLGYCDSTVDTH